MSRIGSRRRANAVRKRALELAADPEARTAGFEGGHRVLPRDDAGGGVGGPPRASTRGDMRARQSRRSTYTERILDVVRNLRKQKAGIEQILGDIRDSQKEVNTLSETLQRSFSAADEVREREG